MKQFTPTPPDRDALLFAAGMAAAKPSSFWKWMCGLLSISQFTMLSFCLFSQKKTNDVDPFLPQSITTSEERPVTPPDPYSYLALMRTDGEYPQNQTSAQPTSERPSRLLTPGWRGELPQ